MSPFAKINSTRSPLLYSAIAALLLTVLVGGVLAVVRHKTITLDVDGEQIRLSTMSTTSTALSRTRVTRSVTRTQLLPRPTRHCPTATPWCSVALVRSR